MKRFLHYRRARAAALAAMGVGVAATLLVVHPPLVVAVHKGIEGEAFKKTIERYSHHGHAVQVVELSYEALRTAVRDSVQGRESQWRFDVVMVDDPWLPELATGLEPIPPEDDDNDFLEPCRRVAKTSTHPGQLTAAPYVGNSQLLCYRTDEHKTAPKSWEDVVRFSVSNSEPDRFGYVMRVKSGNSILTDVLPILWESDRESFSGVPLQLGKNAERAFEQVRKLGEKRRFATASQDDFDLAAYVLREKTSMSIIWSAWAMRLQNLNKATPGALDHFTFGQVPGTPVLGAWLLAVPAISRHKDDALEFVREATSRAELVKAAVDGNPPPRRSVFQHEDFQKKYEQSFREQMLTSLEHAAERPRTTVWKHVEEQVGACLAELSAGLIETEESLKGSREALKRLNEKPGAPMNQLICEENRKRKTSVKESPPPPRAKTQ